VTERTDRSRQGRQTGAPTRRVVLGGIGLLLSGCAGAPAPATYDLSPARDLRRRSGSAIIVVPEPSAIFALDSERIVVRARSGELAYLPRAQWADRLPRLVQNRLIQSFENAGRSAVGRPADRLAARVQLQLDIRLFEVQEEGREAVIEWAAKLVDSATGRIRASRLFASRGPVASIDGGGAAAALDPVLARIMGETIAWASAAV
jgi:cholesterol transport system auxiliary component